MIDCVLRQTFYCQSKSVGKLEIKTAHRRLRAKSKKLPMVSFFCSFFFTRKLEFQMQLNTRDGLSDRILIVWLHPYKILQIIWSASPNVRSANKLVENILAGDNVSVNENAMNFSICHFVAYLQVVDTAMEFMCRLFSTITMKNECSRFFWFSSGKAHNNSIIAVIVVVVSSSSWLVWIRTHYELTHTNPSNLFNAVSCKLSQLYWWKEAQRKNKLATAAAAIYVNWIRMMKGKKMVKIPQYFTFILDPDNVNFIYNRKL